MALGSLITSLAAVSSSTGSISRALSSFFPTLKLLKARLAEVFSNGKTKAIEMWEDAKASFKEHMLNLWEGFEDSFPNLAAFIVNVKKAFSTARTNISEFFGGLGERWDNFKERITTFSLKGWLSNQKNNFFEWLGKIKMKVIETWNGLKMKIGNMASGAGNTISGGANDLLTTLLNFSAAGRGVNYIRENYAGGGIASGPTSGYPAMLHGREAVIPLSGGRSVPVEMRGGAGQVFNIKIDVSGVVDRTDKRALAREIGNLIQSEVARSMGGQTRRGRRA